ncbi:MASE1 domain-containing protein [Piscinibacter sp.]|uniref:MASE1 domain-containing protein n=1 Tax=Piscinibacter sp. TaxID=1903157 RepID=UPI0035AF2107
MAEHRRTGLPNLTRLPMLTPLPWAVVVGYVIVFLVLDWASFIRPLQGLNITPWNPQPALAVALLMASRRLWWVVIGSLLAAELLVRGLPGDLVVVSMAAGALTCSYLAMAAALERKLGDGWTVSTGRDVAWFLAIIALGALLSSVVYVGIYAAGGVLPPGPLWAALTRYWVGDAVGMTVTLPILLVAMDAERRDTLTHTLQQWQWWVTALAIVALLGLLFGAGGDSFNYAYLLLLPVIWACMRFGIAGAVLAAALTQIGLIVAMQSGPHQDVFVVELQLLMASITTTGLLLGVTVDERARKDAELRSSLRLAAAGQMSAALAHELSQPLTALATYAQTCEMLAGDAAPQTPERRVMLIDVTRKISADSKRAGEVIKRLRDFFQTGATHLKACDLNSLVAAELQAQQRRADASSIRLSSDIPEGLPKVWVDEVQIQVVLRNLLVNALDAATARGGAGDVMVRVGASDSELVVEVLDSGAGVTPSQALSVFEPGTSNKVGGMGVGLGICRAIVEAHGGRLWAQAGPAGHFCFTLALDGDDPPAQTG